MIGHVRRGHLTEWSGLVGVTVEDRTDERGAELIGESEH
jgi:hypothetical protein